MNNATFISFDHAYYSYAHKCMGSIEQNDSNYPIILAHYSGKNTPVLEYLDQIERLLTCNRDTSFFNLDNINLRAINSSQVYNRFYYEPIYS